MYRHATIEYNRLQEQSKFDTGSTIAVDSHSLTISLLSTRFLRRHAADISKHKIIKTDILCLTESQICANNDTRMYVKSLKLLQSILTCVERDLKKSCILNRQLYTCCSTSEVPIHFFIRY